MADDRISVGSGWLIAFLAVFTAMVMATVGAFAWVQLSDGSATRTFTIERGTGDRLDAGEAVELMPAQVELAVGDTLVIRNDDDRAYTVGPYQVRAGETIEQTFQRPQVLVGACSLSGTGEIQIVVT